MVSVQRRAATCAFRASAEGSTAPGTIEDALAAGLQVTVWTVNTAEEMEAEIEKGSTAIITDEPDILADVLEKLRAP